MGGIFERASKAKTRFNTVKGNVGTEELWDIPLSSDDGFNLDEIAKAINRKIKEESTESFVKKNSPVSDELELKLAVVKRVIELKLDWIAKAVDSKKSADRKKKAAQLLDEMEDSDLGKMSREELQKELD